MGNSSYHQSFITYKYDPNEQIVIKTDFLFSMWGHSFIKCVKTDITDINSLEYIKTKKEYDRDKMYDEQIKKKKIICGMAGFGFSN